MTDHEKIKQAVRLFLEGIGEDVSREGLRETPDRIARMCEELYGGMDQDASAHLAKTFNVESSGMVIEKDITFYSTCEHHILPFYGKAHIAYIPDGKVVGLSKLARTVEVYARRLQLQEQLTGQIADALMKYMQPKGALVMIEAEHMCMTMRGIKKPGSRTVTLAKRGVFETECPAGRTGEGPDLLPPSDAPSSRCGADRVYFQSGRRRGPGPGAYLYGGGPSRYREICPVRGGHPA